ncbi:pyranose 2-oxidase [Lentinus tigrinus ALCF2SS1-7]|uniref:Pyranose 2-oxidase n=1 Tax=Lentinus tigrinus ALCF2SS1-6 TaxID=1328759 RepID=A0A5C2RWJ3_9APHY|nr:pyranose 2-oxidase [Lentinus tigrinus ALCF2SS1-6]RPD70291.1 pyranose 2-oxidase [Lentinus tigrinus ALCF2SS1-7]
MTLDHLRDNATKVNVPKNNNPALQDFVADVFIAGSGPIGSTYAKLLVEAGYNVIMCEIGAADSFRATTSKDGTGEAFVPGAHKKNEIEYQKDIDRFVNVIKGALSTVSVPVERTTADTLDPAAWNADLTKPPVTNGKNPKQSVSGNLSAEAVTRGVGGMSTHWTCATPRFHRDLELPRIVEDEEQNYQEWQRLYDAAEKLIGTTEHAFDRSIRHTLVLRTLQDAYEQSQRLFKPLPLACHRLANPAYVNWHAADTILEHIYCDPEKRKRFRLLTNHRVTRLELAPADEKENVVGIAVVKDLLKDAKDPGPDTSYISAKVFIVAAGTVATPQILFNSKFQVRDENNEVTPDSLIPNLGRYLTEQPMTFCQVILKQKLLASVPENPYNLPWWAEKVKYQQTHHPEDPLQFPFDDPEPQVTTPLSVDHPWHTQIHRDAFSYGAVAATIDTRTIVDLRFFGYAEPRESNEIRFEKDITDGYGMPQPTFKFFLSDSDKERANKMMEDMCDVALKIGGFLPGSEPQFMAPGLPLHLAGSVRAGLDPKTHVADTHSRVYNFKNLYVGGNGVIPTGFGANPTLTSMGYAIRACKSIIEKLEAGEL